MIASGEKKADAFQKALYGPITPEVLASVLQWHNHVTVVAGEVAFGCAKDLESVIYITIGTGIGVGVYINGNLLHGMMHPEGGHMLLAKHPQDTYTGKCPYHGCCMEGLASGPAIEERWGTKAYNLKENKEVWELEAYYIAQALFNYICAYSPQKIILGGGVMHQEQLFALIRENVRKINQNYVSTKEMEDLDDYIVPASLNDDQGIIGALELGVREWKSVKQSIFPKNVFYIE